MSIFFSGNTYNFGATVAAKIGTGTTSYVFSGLSSGSAYGFIIWAFNSFGSSPIVGPTIFLTNEIPTPEDFSVSQFGENAVILNWVYDPETVIDGFEILRANSPLMGLTFVASDVRGYIDSGLTKGITYTYSIQASYSGNSSKPPPSKSKTLPPSPGVVEPSEPIGFTLAISEINLNTVILNWNKGELGLYGEPDGYQIYRSLTDSNYKLTASTTGATTYSDSSLISGSTYFYKIQSYNSGGPSSLTGPKFIRIIGYPPNTPTGLTTQNIDENSTILQWNDNSINENLFKIYYRT
jgi:titin